MEMLSEHMLQGWLEAYLLTGRHGLFSIYEAFVHIIDSMVNQHAKWLKLAREAEWRKPIASLNYLLSSHVWQQDHNGFTHQDPGFLDHLANKKPDVVRLYLPPDANCLLSVADHCLRSRDYINVIITGKLETPQWLTMLKPKLTAARASAFGTEPVTMMAAIPTSSSPAAAMSLPSRQLAAVDLLREHVPSLRVRFVNVVDLMTLSKEDVHRHALSDERFTEISTADKPIVFAFHGYSALVHRLTSERPNHAGFHVRGYMEEGAATTPFDMAVLNRLDRFSLVQAVLKHINRNIDGTDKAQAFLAEKLAEHRRFVEEEGIDLSEVSDWKWRSLATA